MFSQPLLIVNILTYDITKNGYNLLYVEVDYSKQLIINHVYMFHFLFVFIMFYLNLNTDGPVDFSCKLNILL